MKKEDVDKFEELQAQLKGLYDEMQTLARKNPNDAVNKFKLGLIKIVIADADTFLSALGHPLKYFKGFEEEVIPSNSDVLLVLSQYLSCMEKLRADNVKLVSYSPEEWFWLVDGEDSHIRTGPPKKIKG
jgi:hypothetical protein